MLLVTLLLLTYLDVSFGFTGYDCTKYSSSNIYSAIDPPSCIPSTNFWKIDTVTNMTLLQIPLEKRVPVLILQGRQKIQSFYCTYYRHSVPLLYSGNFLDMDIVKVTPQTGQQLLHSHFHQEPFHGKPVELNQWLAYSISSDVDEKGFCKHYSSSGTFTTIAYQLSAAEMTIQYTIQGKPQVMAVWGEEVVDQIDIHHYYLRDGSLIIVNTSMAHDCQLELVYNGPVDLLRTQSNQTFVSIESISTGLVLGEKQTVCDLVVTSTSASSLFVTTDTVPVSLMSTKLSSIHWSTYIQSIVQYEALHLTRHMSSTNHVITSNLCELEKMAYNSLLIGAKTDPDATAIRLIGRPGWSVRVAGAATLIYKCVPVQLKIVPQYNCTTRVPVQMINSSQIVFMDPSTYTLHLNTTTISCSDPLNPFFKIRNTWYKLTPDLHQVPTPLVLPSRLELLNQTAIPIITGLYPHELLLEAEQQHWYQESIDHIQVKVFNHFKDSKIWDTKDSTSSIITDIYDQAIPHFVPALSVTGILLCVIIIWNVYLTIRINNKSQNPPLTLATIHQ